MGPKKNYYAVSMGKTIGIFDSWLEAGASVTKFKGANHQGFSTMQDAADFMRASGVKEIKVISKGVAKSLPPEYVIGEVACVTMPTMPTIEEDNEENENQDDIKNTCNGEDNADPASSTMQEVANDSMNDAVLDESLDIVVTDESLVDAVKDDVNEDFREDVKELVLKDDMKESLKDDVKDDTKEKNNPQQCNICHSSYTKDSLTCNECKSKIHYTCSKLPQYQ